MKFSIVCLSVIASIAISSCSEISTNVTVVEGKVLQTKSGLPISNATVYVVGFKNTAPLPDSIGDEAFIGQAVKRIQTDTFGKYNLSFEASADSTYLIKVMRKSGYAVNDIPKSVKSNVPQTIDFNFCEAAAVHAMYFNNKSMQTDSLSLVVTNVLPCESYTQIFDYSSRAKYFLGSSIPEPNAKKITCCLTSFYSEDNTEAIVKYIRYVKGVPVETVQKKMIARLVPFPAQDTIHVVF